MSINPPAEQQNVTSSNIKRRMTSAKNEGNRIGTQRMSPGAPRSTKRPSSSHTSGPGDNSPKLRGFSTLQCCRSFDDSGSSARKIMLRKSSGIFGIPGTRHLGALQHARGCLHDTEFSGRPGPLPVSGKPRLPTSHIRTIPHAKTPKGRETSAKNYTLKNQRPTNKNSIPAGLTPHACRHERPEHSPKSF